MNQRLPGFVQRHPRLFLGAVAAIFMGILALDVGRTLRAVHLAPGLAREWLAALGLATGAVMVALTLGPLLVRRGKVTVRWWTMGPLGAIVVVSLVSHPRTGNADFDTTSIGLFCLATSLAPTFALAIVLAVLAVGPAARHRLRRSARRVLCPLIRWLRRHRRRASGLLSSR